MIQIDPNLFKVSFVLDLADLQEVSFALRTVPTIKIFRPISIIQKFNQLYAIFSVHRSCMLKMFLILMALLCPLQGLYSRNFDLRRLQYDRDWDYQPILINQEIVFSSINASGGMHVIYDRYEAIKSILKKYNRPFTVLDLGANNGFFSLKIAQDFDAVCVMVDGTERLSEICTLNTEQNRIIHLQKYFTFKDILELAQQEHFDVVLALFVLHHVDHPEAWVHVLMKLSDNLIIETPPVDDKINTFEHTKKLTSYLKNHPKGKQIGSFPRGQGRFDHMFWFCQNPDTFESPGQRWGISPLTFFKFNGRFPAQNYVKHIDQLMQKKRVPWVLQGVNYYTP